MTCPARPRRHRGSPALKGLGAAAFVALGCALPPSVDPQLDAGGPAGVAVAPPAASRLPEPVVMTPCPTGWSEVPAAAGAPSTCEPWPASGPGPCAADEARFPGEPGCRLVGSACTSDEWADGLPTTGAVLYVRAGAAAGGSGTRAAPYATLAAAIAAAAPGTVVAVGKGAFNEAVRLPAQVTLWGACVGQTYLTAPASASGAVVQAAGLGGVLRNVRLGGPRVGVDANPSGNSLMLEDVIVDGARGVALLAGNTATITGHDVVVRGTQLGANGLSGGRAVSAEYGAKVTLTRVVLENNRENGVVVSEPGSLVSLTDAAIRGTSARGDGAMGRAATVLRQASLRLERSVVEQNREAAILASQGATVSLTDVLVRDTLSSTNLNNGGDGLVFEEDAQATLLRCALLGNRSLGLLARTRAQVAASHLVVSGTLTTEATGADGAGVEVEDGARLVLDHAFLSANHSAGVSATAATVTLLDVEVRDTAESQAATGDGSGLQAAAGAAVAVQRVSLTGNERVGALLNGQGTQLVGADLRVADTRPYARDGTDGAGLAVQFGASATLSRLDVEGNRTVGLAVTDLGSSANLEDVVLRDTASEASSGAWGRGAQVDWGARLAVTRAVVEHNLDVGVFVGSGAVVRLEDVSVADTGKRSCVAAGSCVDRGGSGAVAVGADAALTMVRFVLSRSAQCGLQLAEGAVADLSQGEVAENLIGVSVLTDGYDVARLADRVVYRDNGRKLDSQSMPLPDLAMPRR